MSILRTGPKSSREWFLVDIQSTVYLGTVLSSIDWVTRRVNALGVEVAKSAGGLEIQQS